MSTSSVAANPLLNRADLQRALTDLWMPVRPYLERNGLAKLGDLTAAYGERVGALEAVARPLWGLAPLAAGGGFSHWDFYARLFREGVDPHHPNYWGNLTDFGQGAVEMGAIAYALLFAPEGLWACLDRITKTRLVQWLSQINGIALHQSNWLLFRSLVNAALSKIGATPDEGNQRRDRAQIDSFYRGEGWFTDGGDGQRDYYIPMAIHFYGLCLAQLDASLPQEERTKTIERARLFAQQYIHWFSDAGAAVPFGRSLTYRFAQGAFWGALAFAGVEAMPWGQIKGYYLRHLRAWLQLPIFRDNGLLSVGYAYPNHIIAECYNGPASPYWAFKVFLPLALPESNPFWQADEELPRHDTPVSVQKYGGFVLCRDASRDHVFALASQQMPASQPRHYAQKYGKFVYSTAYGFSVPVGGSDARSGAGDSTLLISLNNRDWRHRETLSVATWNGSTQHTCWSPFPEVQIDSWISPALPGHLRAHRVRTTVPLFTFEGGFPLRRAERVDCDQSAPGTVVVENDLHASIIRDLNGLRESSLVQTEPGTNLLHPLTILPGLTGELPVGETWLFSAVAGLPGNKQSASARSWAEEITVAPGAIPVQMLQSGAVVMTCVATNDSSLLLQAAPIQRRPIARKQLTQLRRRLMRALKRLRIF